MNMQFYLAVGGTVVARNITFRPIYFAEIFCDSISLISRYKSC